MWLYVSQFLMKQVLYGIKYICRQHALYTQLQMNELKAQWLSRKLYYEHKNATHAGNVIIKFDGIPV